MYAALDVTVALEVYLYLEGLPDLSTRLCLLPTVLPTGQLVDVVPSFGNITTSASRAATGILMEENDDWQNPISAIASFKLKSSIRRRLVRVTSVKSSSLVMQGFKVAPLSVANPGHITPYTSATNLIFVIATRPNGAQKAIPPQTSLSKISGLLHSQSISLSRCSRYTTAFLPPLRRLPHPPRVVQECRGPPLATAPGAHRRRMLMLMLMLMGSYGTGSSTAAAAGSGFAAAAAAASSFPLR